MSTILTVPAALLGELRSSLHSVLGDTAQQIAEVVELRGREQHPEWYGETRQHFERACALLDLVGWGTPDIPPKHRLT